MSNYYLNFAIRIKFAENETLPDIADIQTKRKPGYVFQVIDNSIIIFFLISSMSSTFKLSYAKPELEQAKSRKSKDNSLQEVFAVDVGNTQPRTKALPGKNYNNALTPPDYMCPSEPSYRACAGDRGTLWTPGQAGGGWTCGG